MKWPFCLEHTSEANKSPFGIAWLDLRGILAPENNLRFRIDHQQCGVREEVFFGNMKEIVEGSKSGRSDRCYSI